MNEVDSFGRSGIHAVITAPKPAAQNNGEDRISGVQAGGYDLLMWEGIENIVSLANF